MSRNLWMWLGVLGVLGLLSQIPPSEGLMCYHCSNCRHEVGTPLMCNIGYDVCMKVIIVGRVEKSCGRQAICGVGPSHPGTITSWSHLQNLVSDVNTDLLRIPDGMEASRVMCCASDYCNSAIDKKPTTYIALILPLVFYLLLC